MVINDQPSSLDENRGYHRAIVLYCLKSTFNYVNIGNNACWLYVMDMANGISFTMSI